MGKEVYDPEADRKAQEKFGSKNTKKPKAKVEDKHPANEVSHAEEPKEKPPKGDKINKYGFLHVDKELAEHLGVQFGKDKADVPVSIERIEGGFTVKLKA